MPRSLPKRNISFICTTYKAYSVATGPFATAHLIELLDVLALKPYISGINIYKDHWVTVLKPQALVAEPGTLKRRTYIFFLWFLLSLNIPLTLTFFQEPPLLLLY